MEKYDMETFIRITAEMHSICKTIRVIGGDLLPEQRKDLIDRLIKLHRDLAEPEKEAIGNTDREWYKDIDTEEGLNNHLLSVIETMVVLYKSGTPEDVMNIYRSTMIRIRGRGEEEPLAGEEEPNLSEELIKRLENFIY
jgi:hypothetical protein